MLEFRILGPVEVVRDGRSLPLGGAKQRALVVDLTLHANEVLSADRLIDDLWGEEPPESAAHLMHVYVSRLRKTFEDDGQSVLVTRAPGYLLRLEPPDEVDAQRFEAEARRGVELLEGRPAEALGTLERALAMWRGRALEEFADEPFARPSVARLEELRQSTLERRIEALLALSRHDEAVVELEGLIARFPLRERLRELQMLALYRSGRQADALQAFQSARRTLADELGVDPGSALVALEQAILRHDPALEAPTVAPAPRAAQPLEVAPPRPSPRRRRWTVVVASVLVLATAATLVAIRISGSPTPSASPTASVSHPAASDGGAGALTWTEVDTGGAIFGGHGDQVILGGAETPAGLLAVGNTAARRGDTGGPRDYDAALWVRDEKDDWRQIADPSFSLLGEQRTTDAVAIEGRILVVGTDSSHGDHDAAFWTLEDGATSWVRRAPDAPGIRKRGNQYVRAVTWTGSQVVAVGYNHRGNGDEDAAVWTSADGVDWTVLTPTNLGVAGDQEMSSVTTLGDLVVAAGFTTTPEGDRDAAVWTSTDGVRWDQVPPDALGGDGSQQINAIVVGGPGLVAVGQETVGEDEDAAVWISTDGSSWDRVDDPTGRLGGVSAQEMSAVVSTGSLLIAAGRDVDGREIDAAVWTSTDGTTWTRLPADSPEASTFTGFGGQAIRAMLFADGEVIALGRERRGGDDDGAVWIGRPSG